MWRNPPYRWRPALSANKKSQSPSMVVVRPPAARPVVVTQEKTGGSLFPVILGIAAIAFGVMELTGVTHVFGATPAPVPAPKPAPAPGTVAAPAPGGAVAPAAGAPPATPAPTK